MATTIVDDRKWYGEDAVKQEPLTNAELFELGAQETGLTIDQYEDYNPDTDSLPEGRDTRTYAIHTPFDRMNVIYVPDRNGYYLEDFRGMKWRPKDARDLKHLLEEMDHQIGRYGDLL